MGWQKGITSDLLLSFPLNVARVILSEQKWYYQLMVLLELHSHGIFFYDYVKLFMTHHNFYKILHMLKKPRKINRWKNWSPRWVPKLRIKVRHFDSFSCIFWIDPPKNATPCLFFLYQCKNKQHKQHEQSTESFLLNHSNPTNSC